MTKARSRAARKRARANRITLPGGDTAPKRATGRDRRHTHQPEEPADLVALTARARRTGCTVEEARDVLASDPLGRCIRSLRTGTEDRRALLTIWQGLSASWHNYALRCLSITPTPQGASLPMLPDAMQTDQGYRIDLRTGEERDEAARNAWFAWLDDLMRLPAHERNALRGHLQDYAAPVWCDDTQTPTITGRHAVCALQVLHDAREKK